MNQIICINLKGGKKKLQLLSKDYGINYDFLKHNKKLKLKKIWVDFELGIMVAYTQKGQQGVFYTDQFLFCLLEIEPMNLNDGLSVDSILDKISEFGVESLTRKEKEFLDNIR